MIVWWLVFLASCLGGHHAIASVASHRRREFGYLTNEIVSKDKEDVFLVAVVTSPAARPDRRGWLRAQWKKNVELLAKSEIDNPTVVLKFAVGIGSLTNKDIELIHAEDRQHKDILLLPNINDMDPVEMRHTDTSATTEKVLYSIQWVVDMFNFRYFLRLGDDAYFRVDEFYRQVCNEEYPTSMAVVGYYLNGWSYEIISDPNGGSLRNTIAYAAGMGYVFTHDVAAWIASSAGMLSVGYPEDAVVGSWLAGTKVKHIDRKDRFHDIKQQYQGYEPCHEHDVLMHHLDSKIDWDSIDDNGVLKC